MARGLGAFAAGLAEGIEAGSRIRLAREASLRDDRRMALEEQRAKEATEQFGLTKQLTEQQIKTGTLELDQRMRDAAFQKDKAEAMKELEKLAQPGFEGDIVDGQGNSMGARRYASLEEANQDLSQRGLAFRPGSVKKVEPLSSLDLERRFADISKVVAAKHGKLDFDLLEKSRKFTKEIEREGVIGAIQYALTNPSDQKGIRKIFNEKGKVKLGDDVQIGLKDGPFGPSVYGYRVGKDGKPEQVFDAFKDLIMPSMSADAYAAAIAGFKQAEVREAGDDRRNAASNKNAYGIAMLNNRGAMDRELIQADRARAGQKDPKFQELETIIMDPARAAMSNPQNAMNIEQYTQDTMNVMNTAYALYSSGKAKSAPEAAAMAMQIVKQAKQNAQNKPK